LVHKAICSGATGQIEIKPSLEDRIRDELGGLSPVGVKKLLRDFILNGGKCKARRETADERLEEDPDDPWWYFAVIALPQFRNGLFVKVKLQWEPGDPEDDAFVQIVSVHEQGA
jgi:hypothetical protein